MTLDYTDLERFVKAEKACGFTSLSDKIWSMKPFFALIALLLLSSCYNKEFNEPGKVDFDKKPTATVVKAGFARTWAATQRIFNRFPIERKDADQISNRAFIVTDWVRGKSDVLYSGFAEARVPYQIRYKLYVYLTQSKNGRGTQVRIQNIEQYRDDFVTAGVDVEGSIYTWIRTESSTLKENKLVNEIAKLAVDPKFQPN